MNYTQNTYLEMIDAALAQYIYPVNDGQELVADAMRYSIQNGGKRIRPMLTLEFCRVCRVWMMTIYGAANRPAISSLAKAMPCLPETVF